MSPAPEPAGLPPWLLWLHVGSAVAAGAIWYLFPEAGPWPLTLVLCPWLAQVATGRFPSRTGFELPLLLFVLSSALGVWAAYDRQQAWPKLWRIVGGLALFYCLHNAAALGRKRVWILTLLGDAVAVYFLATHDWGTYPAKIARLTALGQALQAPLPSLTLHRLHPNVAGGILAMMVPFAGLSALWAWSRIRHLRSPSGGAASRVSAWVVLVGATGSLSLTLFGLVMSTSRGAWIALASALALALLWLVSRRIASWLPGHGAWILPTLIVLLAAGALAAAAAKPGGLEGALSALPGPDTGVPRMELLRNSLTLVHDYPFIGAGLGGFQMLYSTYALFLHVGFTVHSHNLLVNVAVEQGLPSVLALLWMSLILAATTFRAVMPSQPSRTWRDSVPDDRVAALAAAFLCLTVVLVHGMVDDVLYGSRAVLLLFLPFAFGFRSGAAPASVQVRKVWRHRRGILVPAVLAAALAAALVLRRPLLSTVYSNLGAVHQSRAELSVYEWPKWVLQDEVRRAIDLDLPVREFESALSLSPNNPAANRRLGMIDLSLGRYAQALAHLGAAYSAERSSEVTRSLLSEAYIANGRLEEGQALLADVGNTGGRLAARVFWYGHIGEKEREEWMRQAVELR